eukprot:scaffold44250_cov27-Phaeocystis_antarctica.AAC.1
MAMLASWRSCPTASSNAGSARARTATTSVPSAWGHPRRASSGAASSWISAMGVARRPSCFSPRVTKPSAACSSAAS